MEALVGPRCALQAAQRSVPLTSPLLEALAAARSAAANALRRSYSSSAAVPAAPAPLEAQDVAERLSKLPVAVLRGEDEAEGSVTEYLILGVEHGDRGSMDGVRSAVRLFQPDAVVLEHCPFSLKSELPDALKEIPDFEAAAAVQEAALLPGECRFVLADRLCVLTEWRILAALGFDPAPAAREHLAAVPWAGVHTLVFDMEDDPFQELRADLEEGPAADAFDRALIHERDDVLAWSLLSHPRLRGARRVLALFGDGHLAGVNERMQAGEVVLTDHLAPPPSLYGPAARALFVEHGADPPDATPAFQPAAVAAWLAEAETASYTLLDRLRGEILARAPSRPSPCDAAPPV
eukprot:tig00001056_g6629.t1